MSDFETKTDYLIETKGLLKDRINSLGGSITSGTTFRDYLVWLDSLYEALDEKTITGLPDSLEGKCEQDGTPTPTNPQPINITTGRQVVSVCGKNLFSDTLRQGVTTYNTGQWNNSNSRITSTDWITLKAGTYTISAETTITGNRYLQVSCITFDINGNFYNISGVSGQWKKLPFTFTTPVDLNWKCNISFNDSYSLTPSDVYNIQIELGTQQTTYEEYKGNDYEINLGKNLFDDSTLNNQWIGQNGSISTANGSNCIRFECSAGETYSLTATYEEVAGTYEIIVMAFYNSSGNLLQRQAIGFQTSLTLTKTAPANSAYMYAGHYSKKPDTIQLEKGQPTSYSPYKTPIYLGNIGTYQNYIFRNTTENPLYDSNLEEGQWYIHKEIGRYTFTGTENWQYTSATKRFSNVFSNINLITPTDTGRHIEYIKSNYFYNSTSDVDGGMFQYQNQIIVHNYNYTSASDFKTWLSSHNVEVYYVLNTPTNTLIEDEELINQLNEIEIFTVISEDFYN